MALELRKTKSTNPKLNDAPVVYVDSNNPDPKAAGDETFQAKNILKGAKARWNQFEKRWEWTIMKPEYADMVIRLATKAVDDANEFIQAKAEKIAPLIKALNDIEEGVRGAKGVSAEDVDDVMAKLTSFIRDLQNEVDAVRFDEKIQKYFDFLASSRGYSFNNMMLIMIQDPESTDVRSKTNWGLVDFKPKPDAPSIIMLRPKTRPKSKGMREKDLENFMKQKGYQSQGQMTKPDWIRLKQIQSMGIPIGGFSAYQAYDIRHTEPINPEAEIPTRPNLKWSEDEPSEQADKIREAMISATKKLGIEVEFKDDMGGAKGSSGSGVIHLLQGNDGIGGLSTMAHEMSHEILHQNFLQKQTKEKKSGADDDFLNLYVGRDSSQIMELQAEASAYVVIRNYGMESKTHANYIVLFRNDRKNIEQNLTIITKVANKVIKLTDANMGGIQETIKEELNVAQVANMLGVKMPEQMEESLRTQIRKMILEQLDGPVKSSPKKQGYNYEVYHETLAGAFETITDFLAEKGYEVSDDQLFQFGTGGISYGTTKRYSFELTREGEPAKNLLHVQIYRMDSGMYELNMYYNSSRSIKEYMQNDPQDYHWYCSTCDEAAYDGATRNELAQYIINLSNELAAADSESQIQSLEKDIAEVKAALAKKREQYSNAMMQEEWTGKEHVNKRRVKQFFNEQEYHDFINSLVCEDCGDEVVVLIPDEIIQCRGCLKESVGVKFSQEVWENIQLKREKGEEQNEDYYITPTQWYNEYRKKRSQL